MCSSWKNFKILYLLLIYLEWLANFTMTKKPNYKASFKISIITFFCLKLCPFQCEKLETIQNVITLF